MGVLEAVQAVGAELLVPEHGQQGAASWMLKVRAGWTRENQG